jgi:hypothetical protein
MKKVVVIAALFTGLTSINAQQTSSNFQWLDINRNNASVQSAWQTIQESNNRAKASFKQYGHQEWKSVVNIVTESPNDNNSTALKYTYGQETLFNDNNSEFRPTEFLPGERTALNSRLNNVQHEEGINIFPNPSTDGRVSISFSNASALYDIHVVGTNGAIIEKRSSVNGTNYQLNNLKPGTYIIRIINRQTGQIRSEKLLISRV